MVSRTSRASVGRAKAHGARARQDALDFAGKRVGTRHAEQVIGGRSYCGVCGCIEDANPDDPTIQKWHGDSLMDSFPGGGAKAHARQVERHVERSGGFAISTYGESIIESNAEDSFGPRSDDRDGRTMMLRLKLVDAAGRVTKDGRAQLGKDVATLERNALRWMNGKFPSVRAEGHGGHGGEELVGSFWFDAGDPEQAHLIELGMRERIDMADASYGDLAKSAWNGVSTFGNAVLGGQVSFFDIGKEALEEVEATLEKANKRRRPAAKRPVVKRSSAAKRAR